MWWPFSKKYPERHPKCADGQAYDYIVIGGGTAGCVLTSRLSEDPNVSVLLLERGPANDNFMSRIPIVSSNILRSDGGASSWKCEPTKYCDNRRSLAFCGEVMGGGSRINSMVYTRGTAADYDSWAQLGHPEWSYDKLLSYFMKSETVVGSQKSEYRGTSGPWIIRTFPFHTWGFGAYRFFSNAAKALGFIQIDDPNTPDAMVDGLTTVYSTVNEQRQRVSTFDAFLPRDIALEREKHLTICTNTILSRIAFSKEDGVPRPDMVFFKLANSKSDKTYSAKVKREVIVCSGALGSPQVLMLSGIGPQKHLEEHGISVVKDLPGVGSGLSDHHGIPIAWKVPVKESLTRLVIHPMLGVLEFFKYIFFRSGILSMPINNITLFVRSSVLNQDYAGIDNEKLATASSQIQDLIPDIELMPLAVTAMDDLEEHQRLFSKMGMFSILATLAKPKSRGTVRLASSDPHQRPKVDFGILSNPEDYVVARASVRLSLKLAETMRASGFPLQENITFPEDKQAIDAKNNNDEEIDKFIRRRIRTIYHYSSSCRMAPADDAQSPGVVDDQLKVHGVRGLRVCDTSIFPQIISHHLQAPAVMVAEKCADMIKTHG
ncbi:uncharacterized protein EAE98_004294 [Botrytis deweyae]|uniref:Glucose-methanol-choline oxidoreductase N-terminal domain-containing protein n=1 Tax=Botrytis deweyae TaxID=2478750 RepID=A0ABQ7IQH3_9HELO|nr:uncharacterized protein EAE98_004294 [Botrytis deweyae]KAF7931558.1 hypothetical protein EAE98_004294 [Botrytis deweyae]